MLTCPRCPPCSQPSTVLGNEQHKTLRAAYMFYTCANTVPLQQLMQDALVRGGFVDALDSVGTL